MRRFLVDPRAIIGALATLPESESRHIASVLRLEAGTPVELIDGSGIIYRGLLKSVSKQTVTVHIQSQLDNPESPTRPMVLCQSLLKGKKMDLLVQKATEMGVQTFQPVLSRYCESPAPSPRQLERWNRIMLEACKQSRRTTPMIIEPPAEMAGLDLSGCTTRILFWEGETSVSLEPGLLSPTGPICLVFGPEGGFHEEEIALCKQAAFQTVSLGRLILRAETATMAGIAIVRYLSGAFHAPRPPAKP